MPCLKRCMVQFADKAGRLSKLKKQIAEQRKHLDDLEGHMYVPYLV